MTKSWHAYTCEKGCGHTTIIDKFYKGKRVFCGVCGTKTTMEYQGERLVENAPKSTNLPTNSNEKRELIWPYPLPSQT